MLKSISQLFKKKPNPEALNDYLRWRNGIFTVTAAQVDVLTDQPNQVYGVIMDVGLSDEFTITVTAFPTGDSSVRTTVGGGVIGLGSNEFIADHAKHIVMLAQSIITTARPINTHDLPKSQKVYFYLLTTSGLMLSETTLDVMLNKVALKEVSPQIHIFREMFARFTEIKTRSEELTMAHKGPPAKPRALYVLVFTPEQMDRLALMRITHLAGEKLKAHNPTFKKRIEEEMSARARIEIDNLQYNAAVDTPAAMQTFMSDWLKKQYKVSFHPTPESDFFVYGMKDPQGRDNFLLYYFDMEA